jgi:hypothetical protein
MKTADTTWKLTALVLALLTLGLALPASAAGPVPAIPIPPQPNALPVQEFIGHEAAPYTIPSLAIPPNPHMSPGSWSAIHDDTSMSDTYATAGPLGKAPMTVVSTYRTSQNDSGQTIIGNAGVTTFDKDGRLVVSVVRQNRTTGESWAQLTLMDPVTRTRSLRSIFRLKSSPLALARPVSICTRMISTGP